jgi:alkyl sulfatase BDS1-like metallo-beta-lactamase superfamily hydrolase
LPDGVIKDEQGKVVFDARKFAVLLNAPAPDTWNPSLWRVSQLDGLSGLFQVVDRLYQIRSFDVANMTIMEGGTGLIVIGCTGVTTSAKAGPDLYLSPPAT